MDWSVKSTDTPLGQTIQHDPHPKYDNKPNLIIVELIIDNDSCCVAYCGVQYEGKIQDNDLKKNLYSCIIITSVESRNSLVTILFSDYKSCLNKHTMKFSSTK